MASRSTSRRLRTVAVVAAATVLSFGPLATPILGDDAPTPRPADLRVAPVDDAPAPPQAAPAAPPGTAREQPPVSVASTYRVRSGDTLWRIARLHAVSLDALAAHNPHLRGRPLPIGATVNVAAPAHAVPVELTTAQRRVVPVLVAWADEYGLPFPLLAAVAWHESRWDQAAVSPRGAIGIGQVLPSTAAWLADHVVGARLDVHDTSDNVRAAAAYLRWLLERTDGDHAAALAAYHQGRTSLAEDGWYDVTDDYVRAVFGYWWRFRSASLAPQIP